MSTLTLIQVLRSFFTDLQQREVFSTVKSAFSKHSLIKLMDDALIQLETYLKSATKEYEGELLQLLKSRELNNHEIHTSAKRAIELWGTVITPSCPQDVYKSAFYQLFTFFNRVLAQYQQSSPTEPSKGLALSALTTCKLLEINEHVQFPELQLEIRRKLKQVLDSQKESVSKAVPSEFFSAYMIEEIEPLKVDLAGQQKTIHKQVKQVFLLIENIRRLEADLAEAQSNRCLSDNFHNRKENLLASVQEIQELSEIPKAAMLSIEKAIGEGIPVLVQVRAILEKAGISSDQIPEKERLLELLKSVYLRS